MNDLAKQNGSTEEVVYEKPKLWRRFLSVFIDIFLLGATTAILFTAANSIGTNAPRYREIVEQRKNIQIDSGLFVENGEDISSFSRNSPELSATRKKKEYVCEHLDSFYGNAKYSPVYPNPEYEVRKLNAMDGGVHLFVVDAETNVLLENISAPLEALYSFYCTEAELYAVPLLYNSLPYVETTRYLTMVSALEVIASLVVSYFAYFLIFPFFVFKRGRKTVGRALLHIGMIGPDAVNIGTKKAVLRLFFIFFVYLILGFFSFLLTIIVSVGMMVISRRNQDLADYVLNTYMVDTTKRDVYLDYGDFVAHEHFKKEASLQNRNFKIDNHGL